MAWYEWAFNGVGAALIVFLLTWFIGRRATRAGKGGNASVGKSGYARGGKGGGPGGGAGGHASVGGSGVALGGDAGGGGPESFIARGGAGGGGSISGDGFVAGGEGGEASQRDRGGRGGRSGAEAAGVPNQQFPDGSWLWDYGRGGDGASPLPDESIDGQASN